jgi:hypothetical protein
MNFAFFWDITPYITAAIYQILGETKTNFQQKKRRNFALSNFPPNYT